MKIALLGDIGLLGNYSLTNNPNLFERLRQIKCFLAKFDLVVGNLETPFSENKKTWGAKSAYICTDSKNVDILKFLGVDAVSIANNHMYDFGREGFDTTIRILEENDIKWFGANGQNFKIEKKGNRLAFEGFCCYSTNPLKIASRYGQYGINRFDLREAVDILKKNSSENWLNIFAIHSGIEHVNTPSSVQIYAARELSKISPFVWYGHHPHVVQGIDENGGSVIAHSLGNFCFAGNKEDAKRPIIELSDNNRIGMILILNVENNKVQSYEAVLSHIGEDGTISLQNDSTIIEEYSKCIKDCEYNLSAYKEKRAAQRNQYLSRRKELRNLKWVLKRLRPRYFRLFVDNYLNSRRYNNAVVKQISKSGYEL